MNSFREMDVQVIAKAKVDLDKLILWVLRSRGPLTKHRIIHEIFTIHGFSPSMDRFTQEKLIEKKKSALASAYSLTDEGRRFAARAQEGSRFYKNKKMWLRN
jgi:predicted transcriptional regulator